MILPGGFGLRSAAEWRSETIGRRGDGGFSGGPEFELEGMMNESAVNGGSRNRHCRAERAACRNLTHLILRGTRRKKRTGSSTLSGQMLHRGLPITIRLRVTITISISVQLSKRKCEINTFYERE